jgi:nanoRNase/pAp phosphatase (c-di-AMP/oligoRNAs hydrolase)
MSKQTSLFVNISPETTVASISHSNDIVVIYHGHPCPDGAFAALAAWVAFLKCSTATLTFVPYQHWKGVDAKEVPDLSTVFILDTGGTIPLVKALCKKCTNVIILDHHDTSLIRYQNWEESGTVPDNLMVVVDTTRSGAVMAWNFFIGKEHSRDAKLFKTFAYVQDHDLYVHELKDSRAFTAGLSALKIQYDWTVSGDSLFAQLMEVDIQDCIERGRPVHAANMKDVNRDLEKTFTVTFRDGTCCTAVITTKTYLRNDLGNALAKMSKSKIGVVFCANRHSQTTYNVCLRSIDEVDTLSIAHTYKDGGGHRTASSFQILRSEIDTFKD